MDIIIIAAAALAAAVDTTVQVAKDSGGVTPAVTLAIAIIGGIFGAGGLAAIIKNGSDAVQRKIAMDLKRTQNTEARMDEILEIYSEKIDELSKDAKEDRRRINHLQTQNDAFRSSYGQALSYIQDLLRYIEDIAPEGARQAPKPPREIYEKLRESDGRSEDDPKES